MCWQKQISDADRLSQSLERVDNHVSGKDNVQSSEPEILALVHLHRLLNVGMWCVCVCVCVCVVCVPMSSVSVWRQKDLLHNMSVPLPLYILSNLRWLSPFCIQHRREGSKVMWYARLYTITPFASCSDNIGAHFCHLWCRILPCGGVSMTMYCDTQYISITYQLQYNNIMMISYYIVHPMFPYIVYSPGIHHSPPNVQPA